MRRTLLALAVALLAWGCRDAGTSTAAQRVSPLSEVLTGAFQPGYVGRDEDGARYPMATVRLGDLRLASGRLILADALGGFTDTPPLDLDFPPGSYPVDLALADAGGGDRRVALARLKLSEAAPVRWTMAHTPTVDPATLAPGEVAGFPVDSGTAGFFDLGAVEALKRRNPTHDTAAWQALTDHWIAEGEAGARRLGAPHLFAHVETIGEGGVALTSSGWGDGFFGAWVGWDAADRPVQVIIDFAVIRAVAVPIS